MVQRYQDKFEIVKRKLALINFSLERNDDYSSTFGNKSHWKIEFYGERYEESYNIDIINSDYNDLGSFSIYFILESLGVNVLYQNFPLEEIMNLLIKYKDEIFDETFPYKEKYDELNKIPDWIKTVNN